MTTITLEKAKSELEELLKRARAGEEIVISDGEEPGVLLTALYPRRGFGMFKGKFEVPDSVLFDPLPEDELKLWNGEGEDEKDK